MDNNTSSAIVTSLQPIRAKLTSASISRYTKTDDSDFCKVSRSLTEEDRMRTADNEIKTFPELSKRSDAVSDFLVQADTCTGQVVSILFGHSIDMIIAMLRIIKAEAAYCPIDVESTERRIRHVVENSRKSDYWRFGLPREALESFLAEVGFVCIEDVEHARMTSGNQVAVHPSVAPSQTCYNIFTSGSTGLSKGCVLSHSTVLNSVLQTSSATQIDKSLRVLLFVNYTFDSSIIDIFGYLTYGGRLGFLYEPDC